MTLASSTLIRRSSHLAIVFLCTTAPVFAQGEAFVDIGIHSSQIESKLANRDDTVDVSDSGIHIGIGARRPLGERGSIGFRLEADSIDSTTLLAVRAVDYSRDVSERVALNAFLGAARLNLATAAYGYYLGFGVRWSQAITGWDLNVDLRFGDKVARDNLLPEDPQGGSPDNFHDVTGVSIYLSRGFGSRRNDRQ